MKSLFFCIILTSLVLFANANEINWVKSGLIAPETIINKANFIIDDYLYLNTYTGIQTIDLNNGNLIEFYENDWYRAYFIKLDTLIYVNEYYDDSSINIINNETKELLYSDTLKVNNKIISYSPISDINNDKSMIALYGWIRNHSDEKHYIIIWDIYKKHVKNIFEYESQIFDLEFIDDNTLLISDNNLVKLSIKNNKLEKIDLHHANAKTIKFSEYNNRIFAVGHPLNIDCYLYVLEQNNFNQLNKILVHKDFVSVGIKNNSDVIAFTDTSGASVIYDSKSYSVVSEFRTGYIPTSYLFYKNDYIITFSSTKGRVDLYNYKTKEYIKSLVSNPVSPDATFLSDNEKYLLTISYRGYNDDDDVISIVDLENQKVINTKVDKFFTKSNFRFQADISNFSKRAIITDHRYAFIWDFITNEMLAIGHKGTNVSDVCCNPVKDEFLVSTEDGHIFVYDSLLNKIKEYEIESGYEILSVMYNKSGSKIFAFIYDNESYCIPYEIDVYSDEVNIHNNSKLHHQFVNSDIMHHNYYDKYFCNKYIIYNIENNQIINLPINSSITYQPKSTVVSKNLDYVLYTANQYSFFVELFKITGNNSEKKKPAFLYNPNELLQDIDKSHSRLSTRIYPEQAVFKGDKEIIMILNSGMLVSVNLHDTLNTSYREVSQNGENLISEFYNYDDVLTIEVNPDINRQINYQITDISGNTIQKGRLPQGTSHEQINFFGHPKSSYFIMFHTETSKQIFKFIN